MQGLSKPTLAKLNEDYPKIKNVISENEIEGLLNFLVQILNLKTNSKEEQEHLDFQMILILDLIKTKFGSLTIPEIKEAFKMYVAKEFPEIKVFRILDCIVVGDILNAFTSFRNESLRIYDHKKKSLLTAPKIASDDEKKKIRMELLKIIFEEVQNNGISNEAHFIYDELYEAGLIKISDLDKKILYQRELEKFRASKSKEINSQSGLFRKKLLAEKQQIFNQNQPIEAVKIICKNILTSNFIKRNIKDLEALNSLIFNQK